MYAASFLMFCWQCIFESYTALKEPAVTLDVIFCEEDLKDLIGQQPTDRQICSWLPAGCSDCLALKSIHASHIKFISTNCGVDVRRLQHHWGHL